MGFDCNPLPTSSLRLAHKHMNNTDRNAKPQRKAVPRFPAAPKHARCRWAVLAGLKVTPPLLDDETVLATLEPRVDAGGLVIQAKTRLEAMRREAAKEATPPPWRLRTHGLAIEEAEQQLRAARATVRVWLADEHVPDGVPEGTRWPWRQGGAPWVWRADLLLALPDWSHSAIHGALERLEAEGMLEGSNAVRAKKAAAVRMTARGLKLEELVATLKAHPDVLDGPVGDALNDDAEGGAL